MEGLAFAFAPGDGYVYGAPTIHAWEKLPSTAQRIFDDGGVGTVRAVAFGPDPDSFFLSFQTKAGAHRLVWGSGIPSTLKSWLEEREDSKLLRNRHTKVTLGPNGSYFAWDSKSIKWEGIPAGLDATIQSWLSPSGWTDGPPRIIALGCGSSYFALSEYGSAAWSIPSSFTTNQKETWDKFKELHNSADSTFSFARLAAVAFDPSKPGQYVYVLDDGQSAGDIPEPFDDYIAVTDTLLDDETRAARREKINQAKKEQEEEAKRKKAEETSDPYTERLRRAEAAEKRQREKREEALHKELPLHYITWKAKFESDFNNYLTHGKQLTVFPSIPIAVCTCNIASCKTRYKSDGALMACRHDVEKLLLASGKYCSAWLKTERLAWHPNRFGQKCDPDYRNALSRKAADLFTIFQELIEDLESSSTANS